MNLTDTKQLDWPAVDAAADAIKRVCRDVGFAAPEDLVRAHRDIRRVVEQMNIIAKALLITPNEVQP